MAIELGPIDGLLALVRVIELARLTLPSTPWLTMIGALLSQAEWATMPLLIGQDTLTKDSAEHGRTKAPMDVKLRSDGVRDRVWM